MKVRISMPGATAVKEMEEEEGCLVFQELVAGLFKTNRERVAVTPGPQTPCQGISSEYEDGQDGTKERSGQITVPDLVNDGFKEPARGRLPSGSAEGELAYKGFLYLKCQKCGSVHGFCAKERQTYYRCQDCGYKAAFHVPLVPLWVNCECGKRFKYMTNLTEPEFDVKCIECGAPVAVSWNGKKGVYEPMRG